MLKKATWAALVCIITITLTIHSITYTNIALVFLSILICSDGVLIAKDLKASEIRIQKLETQLTQQNQSPSTTEIIKNINDNHNLMAELRMRLISIQQNINKTGHRYDERRIKASNSLD